MIDQQKRLFAIFYNFISLLKIKTILIKVKGMKLASALKAAKAGMVDTFQVIYNIVDQSPEEELFSYCLKNNISVIPRVQFDEGALTGRVSLDTVFPERLAERVLQE